MKTTVPPQGKAVALLVLVLVLVLVLALVVRRRWTAHSLDPRSICCL